MQWEEWSYDDDEDSAGVKFVSEEHHIDLSFEVFVNQVDDERRVGDITLSFFVDDYDDHDDLDRLIGNNENLAPQEVVNLKKSKIQECIDHYSRVIVGLKLAKEAL